MKLKSFVWVNLLFHVFFKETYLMYSILINCTWCFSSTSFSPITTDILSGAICQFHFDLPLTVSPSLEPIFLLTNELLFTFPIFPSLFFTLLSLQPEAAKNPAFLWTYVFFSAVFMTESQLYSLDWKTLYFASFLCFLQILPAPNSFIFIPQN